MLALVIVKLVIFARSLLNAIDNSEEFILANCDTADSYYKEFADLAPTYLSKFGNYLMEKSIEESAEAALAVLSSLVSAGEQITIFVFDFYLGTYLCLATAAIDGAVNVATNTTEKLIDFANSTISTLAIDINDGLDDVSNVINKAITAIDKIEDLFSSSDSSDVNSKLKTVNLTVEKLQNLYIPSSIDAKLTALSKETPDFSSLMNSTHSKISIPFDLMKSKIKALNVSKMMKSNETLPSLNVSTNSSGICAASKPQIVKFYAAVTRSVDTLTVAITVTLAVVAAGVLLPIAWIEYRQWRRLCKLRDEIEHATIAGYATEYSKSDRKFYQPDAIASYERAFHRVPTALGDWVSTRLTTSIRTKRKIQWCVSYAMSPRALTVLGVAMAGITACICQFILLAAVRRTIDDGTTGALASSVLRSANESVRTDMAQWSAATNVYLNATEQSINDELFGWLQDSTRSVNTTVNDILDDVDATLAALFNGTLLYDPMAAVVRCTVGNKLLKIEHALTWVHDKAHITLPRVNDTALVAAMQSNASSSASSSTSALLSHQLAQNAQKSILRLLRQWHSILVTETLVAIGILALWVVQWPVAIAILHALT